MKVVLLAGGYGTRISEETDKKPKPMVEIGGMPIIWHIMKEYSYYGFNDFIICAGYKQEYIKQWFVNYYLYNSDVEFDYSERKAEARYLNSHTENWKVKVIDTGLNTMTGGRIKRIQKYLDNESFFMTYGDGVCDVDISELLKFHRSHGKIATLTAVLQDQQKGVLKIRSDNSVKSFREKNIIDRAPINAGYMVLEPSIFDYLTDDNCIFEREPLEQLASNNQLMSYTHKGFWQCMDNLRELNILQKLVENGEAPWIKWTN
ncbi:glucose-1-phosphate cytidylyltransferase [Bacteroides caecimuris]|uniref:glucose-1-phosphate cytidylyltransferase n=1 Tax=Bacteroides caecimuris TaxID=1796613 RepID=UPI0025738B37|nr:glucose-1-phosphate cytidylyltransferase [Bacteroides caecimuris]